MSLHRSAVSGVSPIPDGWPSAGGVHDATVGSASFYQDKEMDKIKAENLNLKFRVMFLENRLHELAGEMPESGVQCELKILLEEKMAELENKTKLLVKARTAIDKLTKELHIFAERESNLQSMCEELEADKATVLGEAQIFKEQVANDLESRQQGWEQEKFILNASLEAARGSAHAALTRATSAEKANLESEHNDSPDLDDKDVVSALRHQLVLEQQRNAKLQIHVDEQCDSISKLVQQLQCRINGPLLRAKEVSDRVQKQKSALVAALARLRSMQPLSELSATQSSPAMAGTPSTMDSPVTPSIEDIENAARQAAEGNQNQIQRFAQSVVECAERVSQVQQSRIDALHGKLNSLSGKFHGILAFLLPEARLARHNKVLILELEDTRRRLEYANQQILSMGKMSANALGSRDTEDGVSQKLHTEQSPSKISLPDVELVKSETMAEPEGHGLNLADSQQQAVHVSDKADIPADSTAATQQSVWKSAVSSTSLSSAHQVHGQEHGLADFPDGSSTTGQQQRDSALFKEREAQSLHSSPAEASGFAVGEFSLSNASTAAAGNLSNSKTLLARDNAAQGIHANAGLTTKEDILSWVNQVQSEILDATMQSDC